MATAAAFPRSLPPPSHRPRRPTAALSIGVEDIAQLAHNKVLVAATLATGIGQLSKPLTSALRGNGFDLRAVVRPGGMPSTHSAGVAAAATSLGLERGFADSVFGMAAVFAALVMYDAQGVRREVGYHAKILNRILKLKEKGTPYQAEDTSDDFRLRVMPSLRSDGEELSEDCTFGNPLNESVGHTEIQVIIGAFLGFIVSLSVNTIF